MRALKIALIKNGGLGDHLLMTPFLAHLKKKTGAHVTLIAGGKKDLYENNPHINKFVYCPSVYELQSPRLTGKIDINEFDGYLSEVSKEVFDFVINPHHDTDLYLNAVVVAKLNSARKIGFRQSVNQFSGLNTNNFYNELIERPDFDHVTQYANSVFSHLRVDNKDFNPTKYEVYDSIADREYVNSFVNDNKILFNKSIILHGEASSPWKMLSSAQIGQVILGLKVMGYQPILFSKYSYPGIPSIAGLTIPQLSYFVSRCHTIIGACSALKHFASMHDKNFVEILHLPAGFEKMNGPYVDEKKYKFCCGKYWNPSLVNGRHIVLRPEEIFSELQINQGLAIQSIQARKILDSVSELKIEDLSKV
jgi:ADP-heptose:LPS heptosyltransferase